MPSIDLVTEIPGPKRRALVPRPAAAMSNGAALPPLDVTDEQIDEALAVLHAAVDAAATTRSAA